MAFSDQEKRILETGLETMMDIEVSKFTIDSFSQKIKMSKKTIYKFFPTKENLIEKMIEYKTNTIHEKFKYIVAQNTDPVQKYWEMIHVVYSTARFAPKKIAFIKEKYPHIWKKVEYFRLQNVIFFCQVFNDAQVLGLTDKDADMHKVATLFMNNINSTFQPEFFITHQLEVKEMLLMYADIFGRGLFGERSTEFKQNVFSAGN